MKYFYFFDSRGSVYNPSLNSLLVIEAWRAMFQLAFLCVQTYLKISRKIDEIYKKNGNKSEKNCISSPCSFPAGSYNLKNKQTNMNVQCQKQTHP